MTPADDKEQDKERSWGTENGICLGDKGSYLEELQATKGIGEMKLQRLIEIRICKARLNIILGLYSVGMRHCLIRTLNDSFDIIPNLPSEAMNK